MGVRLFRWDSPHQIPLDIAQALRRKLISKYPDILFYGETLGCAFGFTEALAREGFSTYGDLMWWMSPAEPHYEDQLWITIVISMLMNAKHGLIICSLAELMMTSHNIYTFTFTNGFRRL